MTWQWVKHFQCFIQGSNKIPHLFFKKSKGQGQRGPPASCPANVQVPGAVVWSTMSWPAIVVLPSPPVLCLDQHLAIFISCLPGILIFVLLLLVTLLLENRIPRGEERIVVFPGCFGPALVQKLVAKPTQR